MGSAGPEKHFAHPGTSRVFQVVGDWRLSPVSTVPTQLSWQDSLGSACKLPPNELALLLCARG